MFSSHKNPYSSKLINFNQWHTFIITFLKKLLNKMKIKIEKFSFIMKIVAIFLE